MAPCSTIFIMDTDKHVRELLVSFLSGFRCSIILPEDGRRALEMVALEKPCLVITEVLVPRLDGLSLCRAIKLSPSTSDVPVIVSTVLGSAQRARLAGADYFLPKPYSEATFLAAVRQLVPNLPEADADPVVGAAARALPPEET